MKIVVTVKQVPDPNGPSSLEADGSLARDGEAVLDPGDESGVEIGVRLSEVLEAELVLVSMGPDRARDAIRKGLSMGATRGILVSDRALAGADALQTARVLAAAIGREEPDLVICATESYDGSSGMVPPMLAELLGLPQLTFAKSLEVENGKARVHRQSDAGYDVVEAALPALVTVTAGIAEPRYATLKGIMAARSKAITHLSLADLGLSAGQGVEVIESVQDAPPRGTGEMVAGDAALERIVAVLRSARAL